MSVNASIMSDVFVGIGERRRSSAEDTVGGQCVSDSCVWRTTQETDSATPIPT